MEGGVDRQNITNDNFAASADEYVADEEKQKKRPDLLSEKLRRVLLTLRLSHRGGAYLFTLRRNDDEFGT